MGISVVNSLIADVVNLNYFEWWKKPIIVTEEADAKKLGFYDKQADYLTIAYSPGATHQKTANRDKNIPLVIWPSLCYTQRCGPNERPVDCIDRCQRCEYINGGCAQPAVCTPGCDCIPGYFRNKQNQCVPAAFCPGNFPCSQEVDPGPCYGYIPRFFYNKRTGQCEEFIYGGCKGNLNNFFDKDHCELMCKGPPQQCPADEVPVKCIDRCQRCEYKNGNCVQIGVCTPGCNCKPGFLRDSRNKCIPAAFCPGTGPGPLKQCPAFEYPVGCIDRCQRCEYKNGNCAQAAVCTPGCNCVPGFLRDRTNKCIPRSHCP